MKNIMKYKEYLGSVNYNDEDEIFYGKVEYIRSLISYEGHDVESLRASFHEAVDEYLELCQQKGVQAICSEARSQPPSPKASAVAYRLWRDKSSRQGTGNE